MFPVEKIRKTNKVNHPYFAKRAARKARNAVCEPRYPLLCFKCLLAELIIRRGAAPQATVQEVNKTFYASAHRRIIRASRAQKGLNRYARSALTQARHKLKALKLPTKRFY